MKVEMRYARCTSWTLSSARTDDWREAAVRVYNRKLRDVGEGKVDSVAACTSLSDNYFVVQFGYPMRRGDSGVYLTPQVVVWVTD